MMDDLTGRRFGRLVALRPTERRASGSVVWGCQCDCGRAVEVAAASLKNGSTKSCGCIRGWANRPRGKAEVTVCRRPRKLFVDLTGKRVGKLVVLRATSRRVGKNGDVLWECQCDCGNVTEVRTSLLISGRTRSCGCLHTDKHLVKDLTGQRFGRLTVLRATDKRHNNMVVWECKCDCGRLTEATTHALMSGGKRSCGCLRKEKRVEAKRVCEICGQKFTPNAPTQRKCKACKNKVVRACERCGARIVVDRRCKTRYCSACVEAAKKENLAKRRAVCSVCGREFVPNTAAQKKCPECRGKMRSVCEVCGKEYISSMGGKSRYCPECRGAAGGASRTGKYRAATEAFAAMRREYAREHADEMRAGAANAMEAARNSPLAGGYESNVCAKNWVLCDPSGNEHHVTNLKLYVREHPEAFPNPASAYSMFVRQSGCLRDGRPMEPKTCCGGWYVVDAPTVPEETRRYVEEREKKKRERAEYIARKQGDKKE